MACKVLAAAALAVSAAVVLVAAAPPNPCGANPSQPGYVTLAPSFNPALADSAVSSTPDCLAQDGTAIRPGYLVTSGGSPVRRTARFFARPAPPPSSHFPPRLTLEALAPYC